MEWKRRTRGDFTATTSLRGKTVALHVDRGRSGWWWWYAGFGEKHLCGRRLTQADATSDAEGSVELLVEQLEEDEEDVGRNGGRR